MILYRTKGRTSRYVVLDPRTGEIEPDAAVFFPAKSRDGLIALNVLLQYVTKEDRNATKVELAAWIEELRQFWKEAENAKTF